MSINVILETMQRSQATHQVTYLAPRLVAQISYQSGCRSSTSLCRSRRTFCPTCPKRRDVIYQGRSHAGAEMWRVCAALP
jgi:primosomal protein N''